MAHTKKTATKRKTRKDRTTNIVMLLDRSGSMYSYVSDHEGGIKKYIEEQAANTDTKATFTLIKFDSTNPFEIVYDRLPITDVDPSVRLQPRGNTPLLDSLGKTIHHMDNLKNVICVIITDGEENCSREFTTKMIRDLVERKSKEGWEFVYLGCNIDSFREAGSMGITINTTADYGTSMAAINNAYAGLHVNSIKSRELVSGGFSANMSWTDTQRHSMLDDEDQSRNVRISQNLGLDKL